MLNIIYEKVIVPSRESYDGETPTMIVLTDEVNAYILWRTSYDHGQVMLNHWPKHSRAAAIEEAVREANAEILDRKDVAA